MTTQVNDYAIPFKAKWWTRYMTGHLDHAWPKELDQLAEHPEFPGHQAVTRADVFAIAAADNEHRELRTAVAAYVWGTGKNTFQVGRLVRAFTRNDDVESRLRSARATLLADGPVAAYEAMRFGDARIKFMGPAFFTKFLYFTGYQDPGYDHALRPLILDNRVAKSLLRWDPAGDWATVGWGSSAYDAYLRIAHEQEKLSPEQAELVLFAAKGDQLAPPAGWSWPER